MILIVTSDASDSTVADLRHALDQRGAETVVLSPETLSAPSSLRIDAQGGGRAVLSLEDRELDLTRVRSAWLWRPFYAYPESDKRLEGRFRSELERSFFLEQWRSFYNGLSLTLRQCGVFCVNPPPANFALEEKCSQLLVAAQVGLRIPPTLYTTRLPVARAFFEEHGGHIIYKPFRTIGHVVREDSQSREVEVLYTNRVQAEHLVEPEGFIPSPSIFQPYVPKQIELRIVVVGRRVLACAIHSQQTEKARDDWRRFDLAPMPHVPHTLPDELQAQLVAYVERLGLVFGSIDMILTPEGEYVFLEINPNGQFGWVVDRTRLPIFEHLAAMLHAGSVDYPAPSPTQA
ncbi:MAG: hypothetical protein JXB05_27905 [Myxococcaceae bacterium]|nr:hypothetical protein [Myxococcaceae bacterium]